MFLLPVILLAISCAVESLLASRAYFMLAKIAFRCSTEAAFFYKFNILFALFCLFGIFFKFNQVFKPLVRSIMVPRVDGLNLISMNTLSWKLFRREFVQEIVLIFLAEVIKAVLEVRLNDLDCDLGFLSLFHKSLLFLTHAVVS